MKPSRSKKNFFTAKDIATIGIMAALLEVVKIALQSIPNVELVTFLIIVFTLYLGPKALVAVWAFVGMEIVHWGFGLWTAMYIYIWPLLVVIVLLFRRFRSKWPYIIISALFGLFFGALCAVPYIFINNLYYAFSWWVSGIPYDIIHCISNGLICFFLFDPARKVLFKFR